MSEERELPGLEAETAPEHFDRYLDSSGTARPTLWRIGVRDLDKLNIAGGFYWQEIGPSPLTPSNSDVIGSQGTPPVGGEVTDIAIDPTGTGDQIIYMATNNGGIWKTTDGGDTWQTSTDSMPSLSMGAVAIDASSPSIIYAGSGNLFDGELGFVKAAGLYKSVDAGRTWFVADGGVFSTSLAGMGINRIVVTSTDRLLVGTDRGLFRSIDGGLNFGSNAPSFDNGQPIITGFVSSLTMDTAAAGVAWVAIKGVDRDNQPFAGGGLFKLTLNPDGSVTPSGNQLAPVLGGARFSSIVFAQSARDAAGNPNSDILYATVQDRPPGGKNRFLGLYRFGPPVAPAAAAWQLVPSLSAALAAASDPNNQEDDQTNYDFTLGVDPQNPDLVYAGFKRIFSSANATTAAVFALSSQGSVHWDQHELIFSPQVNWVAGGGPTSIFVGSDGGFARRRGRIAITGASNASPIVITAPDHTFSTGDPVTIAGVGGNTAANGDAAITVIDNDHFSLNGRAGNGAYTGGGSVFSGNPQWTQRNSGVTSHLFNGIDIGRGAANNASTFGGAQDNGTFGHRPADGALEWTAGIDGDGGVVAVDPANPQIVYGFDNEFFIKTFDGGGRWEISDTSTIGITGASNGSPSPIVITTAAPHLFLTGDTILVQNVGGNTNANGNWIITFLSATTFSLNGSNGAAAPAYTTGGTAQGRRIGRNLRNPSDSFVRRVALVPSPATLVYVSEGPKLYKSTDAGATFSSNPIQIFSKDVFAIVCPDATRIWVGLGDGTVQFSPNAGTNWQEISPGGTGPVTGIAVDAADINRVAVVYAGFSEINSSFRTRHCFLTTDNGASWTDIGGTDGANTGNLPDLPLHSVAFDASTAPSTIIVASDVAVMRSANNGTSWERLGGALPHATCRSLVVDHLDTAQTPRLLRVGTYGRSAFERARQGVPHVVVEANLGFGPVKSGVAATLRVRLFNASSVPVTITSFSRTSGVADFDFASPPTLTPLAPGDIRAVDIKFTAAESGIRTAIFTLVTNDSFRPSQEIPASGLTFASGAPRISVNANLNFGLVERGANRTITIEVGNTGLGDLMITSFTRTDGSSSFELLAAPAFPLTITPGAIRNFDIRFTPGTFGGDYDAKFRIANTDAHPDPVEIAAKGTAPFNTVLVVVLVVLGAAVIGGAIGLAAYEAAQSHH